MRLARWLVGVVAASPLIASASWFNTQFSADTYQTQPHQAPQTGKLYVGDNRMRSEMSHQGQSAVQIMDPSSQRAYLIYPEQKAYMEQPLPGPMTNGKRDPDPCAGMPGFTCRNLGQEVVSGRPAVKWEMSGQVGGQSVRALQWNDAAHGFPVQREQGGQTVFQLRYLGSESVNGRQTEKWESAMVGPSGQKATMLRWYDPRLNTAVREEMPGGHVRELRNVKEGPQAAQLFTVPEGYRKIEPPPAQTQPQGGPPR